MERYILVLFIIEGEAEIFKYVNHIFQQMVRVNKTYLIHLLLFVSQGRSI